MARFFVAATNIFGGIAIINGEDAAHFKTLRIRNGEKFTVCDGEGNDYLCTAEEVSGGEISARILEKVPSAGEPSVACTVYAAFSKGDKMETVIQKCVELGASEIVLFPSARCVARPDDATLFRKLPRWQKIAYEAAKQSGRGRVPTVSNARSYDAAVKKAAEADVSLFLYEEARELGLRQALESVPEAKTIALMTGPEGGFTPEEAAAAEAAGMRWVTMGSRILRCETAPVAAVCAAMLLTGNMD